MEIESAPKTDQRGRLLKLGRSILDRIPLLAKTRSVGKETAPAPDRWLNLYYLGVVGKIALTEGEEEVYVTNQKMMKKLAAAVQTTEPKTVERTFQTLTDHFDRYHQPPFYEEPCACPLQGHHVQGTGALFTPDSLVALGSLLNEDPTALRRTHIWDHGAKNIISLADTLNQAAPENQGYSMAPRMAPARVTVTIE